MPALKESDRTKWINALIAVGALIVSYALIKLLYQVGDWMDLEARVNSFRSMAQGAGIVAGIITFVAILKNKKAYAYLDEVYGELLKVTWSDKDSTLKLTVVIVIGVTIAAVVLGLMDFGIRNVLELLY